MMELDYQMLFDKRRYANISKVKKDTIEVKGVAIQIYTEDFKNDYVSLTDIAKYKNREEPNVVVANWMRN
ncbi:hypothetical protein HNQ46_001852 [Oribacterium sinus]|jgi:hypothetical protein|uniref:Uncharacterized protein n=1 Tax=Oribacterium sinus TaxID=237576 RepID=A0A7W9SH31_9FIRM|nr:hypothetical protein [Oribacterium sinus]